MIPTTFEDLKKENEQLKEQLNEASQKIENLEGANLTAFSIGNVVMDGICEVDKNGYIINVNEGFTKITEIQPEEIIGKNVDELVDDKIISHIVFHDVMATKEKKTIMATIYRNNIDVLLTGMPILDKHNNLVKVITVLRNLTDLINLREKLEEAEKSGKGKDNLMYTDTWKYFTGSSSRSKAIKELIQYVAPTDATVLIVGETGAGKEVIAREIYERSNRKDGPYIKINCAAIPENLLESELFGYVKGAFTGADNKNKKGRFEMANGGTILLDEFVEMPINLQPKLLRVLQEREITPLGAIESVKIDTRIIASCNKDPEELVEKGLLRADLYYRLNVFPINMPSLKERREDIPDIAISFLEKFNKQYNKKKLLGNSGIFALMNYDWPGNVRELENAIERMVIISSNKILTKEDVSMVIKITEHNEFHSNLFQLGEIGLKEAVKELEKQLIQRALQEGGSSYGAAKLLKTTQPTVIRKAHALGIKTSKKE